MIKDYFGRIDLLEGYSILGLAKVDFDNTYPGTEKSLSDWMAKWEKTITNPIASSDDNNNLRVTIDKKTVNYFIPNVKNNIVKATALLISLTRAGSFENVEITLLNVFSDERIVKEYL